ncbi:MAG TPA: carboxypeptidase regulatory-like domain-containing protein [bacterium]|nr:carboxypeptidase regulatory-like domain-containing protein [bacterium]
MLKCLNDKKGFTLIDVIVGTSLMLIVFLSIFGAYQLAIKVINQSKHKITAVAIANEELEMVRNLPYPSIGTIDGFPEGTLKSTKTTSINNVDYTINTRVDFVIDPIDGITLPEDDCPNDYKKVEVEISWQSQFNGSINISTDVAPKNLAQECATGGGILSVSVFDAQGIMIPSPEIEVIDPETDNIIKTATPADGQHYFSLDISTYKVIISKNGYSSERTYGTEEIITPEKPHLLVLEDQLTETSFSIDKVSSFSIETLSPWGQGFFSDSFADQSKTSELSNVIIQTGEGNLDKIEEEYFSSGYLISTEITPVNITTWEKLSWTDSKPLNTELIYQILYFDEQNWILIPNIDLPGNLSGFTSSPLDLSELNASTYPQLKIKASFSTSDTSFSPTLYDWQVSWITAQATPIPYASFNLRGTKIIGTDADEEPVYKYSETHLSDSQGQININNLEWDSYTFSTNPVSNLDLIDIDPSPQPISLSPDTNLLINLFLEAENSLLITVQDNETFEPIFASPIRIYNASLSYDTTLFTNEKGQVYFIPLETSDYNLEISASGYLNWSGSVSISGDITKIIHLEQIE